MKMDKKSINNLINNIEFNNTYEAKGDFEKVVYSKVMNNIQDSKKELSKNLVK